jgi:hypothetical protein
VDAGVSRVGQAFLGFSGGTLKVTVGAGAGYSAERGLRGDILFAVGTGECVVRRYPSSQGTQVIRPHCPVAFEMTDRRRMVILAASGQIRKSPSLGWFKQNHQPITTYNGGYGVTLGTKI